MSRSTTTMREFARRLIACEAQAHGGSRRKSSVAFPVCARLRPHLATLVGNAGYCALLSRALALAGADVPWLRTVQVQGDGSLKAPEDVQAQIEPKEILEGRIVLLTQLLGLLVAFIGENLTLRLVSEIWPKAALDDLSFDRGDKNEKTE